jgi:hypothetical protein
MFRVLFILISSYDLAISRGELVSASIMDFVTVCDGGGRYLTPPVISGKVLISTGR